MPGSRLDGPCPNGTSPLHQTEGSFLRGTRRRLRHDPRDAVRRQRWSDAEVAPVLPQPRPSSTPNPRCRPTAARSTSSATAASRRRAAGRLEAAEHLGGGPRPSGPWGAPRRLPPCVNDGQANFFPSPDREGTLYFTRQDQTTGKATVWQARKFDSPRRRRPCAAASTRPGSVECGDLAGRHAPRLRRVGSARVRWAPRTTGWPSACATARGRSRETSARASTAPLARQQRLLQSRRSMALLRLDTPTEGRGDGAWPLASLAAPRGPRGARERPVRHLRRRRAIPRRSGSCFSAVGNSDVTRTSRTRRSPRASRRRPRQTLPPARRPGTLPGGRSAKRALIARLHVRGLGLEVGVERRNGGNETLSLGRLTPRRIR